MMRIAQQLGQGRASSGRDDFKWLGKCFFHAPVLDRDFKFHGVCGSQQEGTFLGGRFMQGDLNPVPQQFRQDQAWKTGPGPQIRQGSGIFGHQGRQLGGIPEMPPPQILQGAWRHQIVAGIPVQQQIGIALEPGQCFT